MAATERSRSTPQQGETMFQMAATERSRSIPQQEMIVYETSTPGIDETISEDGILCNILSSLTLAEAVRTSVLSSRWRHLWKCRTKFHFDALTVLEVHTLRDHDLDDEEAYNLTKGKTTQFIRSVNSVLPQLQGAKLDEFAVTFFLDKTHSHHLDEWVRFAVASKTKLFRLHLFRSFVNTCFEPYAFPCHLLESASSIEKLSLSYCSLSLPSKFDGFSNLKLLFLVVVEISEHDYHLLLSSSSSTLTKLLLWCAPQLETISISSPLSQLETLIVRDCNQLKEIEINAPNLLKLHYEGLPVDFKFRKSSKLNDALVHFKTNVSAHNLDFYLTNLSSSMHHLRSLTLKISNISQAIVSTKGSCRFNHLRHLDIEWNGNVKMSLLHLATLMDATPFLEEVKICLSERMLEQPPQAPSKFREILPKHPNIYLKAIQISGFYSDTWQLEIAAYLLNYATELRTLTIEKGKKSSWFRSKEIHELGMNILRQHAPANVKLLTK